MPLHSALYSHLTSDADVSALISNRLYTQHAPQRTDLPYAVMNRVSALHTESFSGASGLVEATMQITCWASTPDGAEDLAEKIRLALHGFRGQMGTELLDVRRVGADGPTDIEDLSNSNADTHDYGRAYDFTIWHAEAVPP